MENRTGTLENLVAMSKQGAAFWKNRRVLVTGGSGFIGYALVQKLLALGAKVTILDIKKLPKYLTNADKKAFHFVQGSVVSEKTVRSVLKNNNIQTVFHLAAEAIVDRAHKDPAATLEHNVKGTWILLESARTAKSVEEVIVASSDKAYGSHKKLPYVEDAPLIGTHPYDVSKSAADLISTMFAKTYGFPVAIARCGNVYGAGDLNWSRLIPGAFASISSGKELHIRSDGESTRDYVFVDDIVGAYCILAENIRKKKLYGEAFNFGTREPVSVKKVLKLIEAAAGKKVPHKILNVTKSEIRAQYLDSSKAQRVLGWRPKVARTEGFKRTAAWYGDFFA